MGHKNRPLLIASSGGGGHIAAIKGIADELKKDKNTVIKEYVPRQHKKIVNRKKAAIKLGAVLSHTYFIRKGIKYSQFPELPAHKLLNKEIEVLDKKERKQGKEWEEEHGW